MATDIFGNVLPEPNNKVLTKKQAQQASIDKKKAIKQAKEDKRNAILNSMPERTMTQIATIETTASFRNRGVVMVDIYRREQSAPLNPNAKNNLNNFNGNSSAYNGYLSPATRRYVERMMSVWLTSIELNAMLRKHNKEVNSEKVFPTFVTLTLPSTQLHTDNTIKSDILAPFIKWLTSDSSSVFKKGSKKGQKKGFGVTAYFWRAEAQKNTKIHFHVIADKYVPWERIREKWNQCCERLGYVTRYSLVQKSKFKDGFWIDEERKTKDMYELESISKNALEKGEVPEKISKRFEDYLKVSLKYQELLDESILSEIAEENQKLTYENAVACDHKNPPSTEIRAIQHLDSVAAYVIKYVAKKPTEKPLRANQELKFNEVLNRECVYTYDLINNPQTGEIEKVEKDMRYFDYSAEEMKNNPDACYKREFLERKINGRIWGCADILRGFKPSDDIITETDEIGRTFIVGRKIIEIQADGQKVEKIIDTQKMAVPIMKYFTKIVNIREVILTEQEGKVKIFVSPVLNEDYLVIDYLEKLESLVGKDEVERISKQLGPSFEKIHGKIIPFRNEKMGYSNRPNGKPAIIVHSKVLQDNSPKLYDQYIAYHQHIYNCFYNSAA